MTGGYYCSRTLTKPGKRRNSSPVSLLRHQLCSYSHVWLKDLGLNASSVDSVRFYCKASGHNRVIHFSNDNDFTKKTIENGNGTGNIPEIWHIGHSSSGSSTAFEDHTGCYKFSHYVTGITRLAVITTTTTKAPIICSASHSPPQHMDMQFSLTMLSSKTIVGRKLH